MKGRWWILLALVLLAGGIFAVALIAGWLPWAPVIATAPEEQPESTSQPIKPREVVALGRLVPANGVISLRGSNADRLVTLSVREGDTVVAGQVLGELESLQRRRLELELARSQLAEAIARREAEAELAEAKVASARLAQQQAEAPSHQLQAQQQQIKVLELALEQAENDLARLETLSQELVSAQEREHQQLLVSQREAELESARAELEAMKQSAEYARQVAQTERLAAEASRQQIVQAIPVQSLQKQVELAELQLQQSQLVAPTAGTILKVFTQPGQYLTQQPILQMANLDQMICIAEVYESDLRHLRLGQPAAITSKALGGESQSTVLHGTVTRIGQMIVAPELKSVDPFAPVDRHIVEVRVDLEPASAAVAARWVNLQVEVRFLDEQMAQEMAGLAPAQPQVLPMP